VLAQATVPVWFQVSADDRAAAAKLRAAVEAGCRIGFVTLATGAGGLASRPTRPTSAQWSAVESLARSAGVPLVVKGVTTVDDAGRAIDRGAQGLVVSEYGQPVVVGQPLLLSLPAIVDAVAGRVPVLVDGGFRRGTDVLKALAFGARGVLVGRPLIWGLAAYGAEGVQGVLEMLRTELARYMAMCGNTTVASLSRAVLKVHPAMPETKPGQERA
jgi:4-hydroxymandelate oxidase